MTDPAENDHGRLLVSLSCGLLLVAPLTWTVGATSYVGVLLGVVGCGLVATGFGLLMRRAAPGSLGIALVTVAYFVPAALAALLVAGPADDPATTALSLGIPMAALAAVGTVRTARVLNQDEGREGVATGGILVGLSLALCAAALVPNAADRIEDGRDAALVAAALEGAGVRPLMVEIDGLTPSEVPRVDLDSTGYWIDLEADGEDVDAPSVRIDVGRLLSDEEAAYEQSLCDGDTRTCRADEDGYVVREEVDGYTHVTADVGRTRLDATLFPNRGELPEPDEIGRALVAAEIVDWDDLLRMVVTGD